MKPIEAGLPISENYGPIYTQEMREERQAKLRDLYRFDCSCDACLENWPTFDKLPTDVIRFRCDAPNKCNAIIEVSPACNDFMIKCVTCGEMTNIFKGLKVMQVLYDKSFNLFLGFSRLGRPGFCSLFISFPGHGIYDTHGQTLLRSWRILKGSK